MKRYFTIEQAAAAYDGVLGVRLLRRLVAQRRIAFSRAGRLIVFSEEDLEGYLVSNRQPAAVEAWSTRTRPSRRVGASPKARTGSTTTDVANVRGLGAG